jgi:hypothetical protein
LWSNWRSGHFSQLCVHVHCTSWIAVVLCVSGKQLTILNAAVELCGSQASLKLLMWPALSERLKTPGLCEYNSYVWYYITKCHTSCKFLFHLYLWNPTFAARQTWALSTLNVDCNTEIHPHINTFGSFFIINWWNETFSVC